MWNMCIYQNKSFAQWRYVYWIDNCLFRFARAHARNACVYARDDFVRLKINLLWSAVRVQLIEFFKFGAFLILHILCVNCSRLLVPPVTNRTHLYMSFGCICVLIVCLNSVIFLRLFRNSKSTSLISANIFWSFCQSQWRVSIYILTDRVLFISTKHKQCKLEILIPMAPPVSSLRVLLCEPEMSKSRPNNAFQVFIVSFWIAWIAFNKLQ